MSQSNYTNSQKYKSYTNYKNPSPSGPFQRSSNPSYKDEKSTTNEEYKQRQRQERFNQDLSHKNKVQESADFNEDNEWNLESQACQWKIVGTSTTLEKPYLRLTKEPDASIIRPEPILKKALELLLTKWRNQEVTYNYIADQFRSLRQDLTVQQIKDEFTARVYEENIRICLECDDINYFNQCQSQLMDLYRNGIASENKPEFLCYRFIYFTLGEASNDLNKALNSLSDRDFASKEIEFAMRLRHHYTTGNTKAFFLMYKSGFLLTKNLIEMFIHRIRILALRIITKSFGEKISAQYLSELLGFDGIEKFTDFVTASKGILSEDKQFLMNKESFKIYDDHPWLTSKLTTHKLLVSQKAV